MNILFWSGGKDAFLALHFYKQQHPRHKLALLTTYEEKTGLVPHQQLPISHIRTQAAALDLDLHLVPLPRKCSNEFYLREVNGKLDEQTEPVEHLIFGDRHLSDIRQWREASWKKRGYRTLFPIWEKNIHELLPVLQLQPIRITISAVEEKYQSLIRIGETYDQAFVTQLQHLPEQIDLMGEHGEFHTKVSFADLSEQLV
ncbi:hypothetical protein [Fodinibius sediminis]|uniref:Diphthamide synthase (EF-2-diphthine--ammonia ligase) n=1 Tax=Fodinibius sediminis TaxID=1214077 RepID=A0A521DTA9_9BACT|nr:hypothetical protein [Fodinibius sediminis]SMO74822.1 Diphthamide synthase (EF-2-diphthine--ammonia ligase) [Fodinibius sediminis]